MTTGPAGGTAGEDGGWRKDHTVGGRKMSGGKNEGDLNRTAF